LSVFRTYKSLIMQKPVWKKIAEEISLEVSLGRWTAGSDARRNRQIRAAVALI
jgi:hypothetical protein